MVGLNTKERGRSKIVCVKLKRSDHPLGNEGNVTMKSYMMELFCVGDCHGGFVDRLKEKLDFRENKFLKYPEGGSQLLGLNTTCSVCCGAHFLYPPSELRLSFLRLPGVLENYQKIGNCPENYPSERQASQPRFYCLLSDSSHPMAGQYSDMKMRFSSLHLSYPEWPCQLENGAAKEGLCCRIQIFFSLLSILLPSFLYRCYS